LVVQVAAFASRARAEEVARRVGNGASVVSAGNVHRVRMGPFADEAAARAAIARARAAGQPGAVILRGQ
jgi:rare lipoprotein A